MRYALPAIAVAYAVCACAADDHLAPCDEDFAGAYGQRVEAIGRAAMPGPADFWVTVIPSLTPEWSLGVSSVKGRYLLTHVAFDRSLWNSSWVETAPDRFTNDPSKGHAHAKATTTPISAELYAALRSEWERSVTATRQSTSGLDGITYYFRLPGKCASTWSPEAGTRNRQLVDFVSALVRLAHDRSAEPAATKEADALRQLRELPPIID